MKQLSEYTAETVPDPDGARAGRVLLVAMPFASAHHPNLGLSLLQAAVRRDGVECDIRYLFLEFAETIGAHRYGLLTDDKYFVALLGEWLFSPFVHGEDSESDLGYCTDVLRGQLRDFFPATRVIEVMAARRDAEHFLTHCLDTIPWERYSLVGFSTSFQQTMASLALAKRLKERFPRLTIVFGGANCEGEMGIELHRRYPFLDVVCSGEADLTFPEIVRRSAVGLDLEGIDATIVRRAGHTVLPRRLTCPVEDMNSLPTPNFGDFYEQHARCKSIAEAYHPVALFETARGCWWGAKSHCTFCGLNGSTMAYRSKSPERAFDELRALIEEYGPEVLVVDNILSLDYFKTLLPRIAASDLSPLMHYETKVNLTARQISMLAAAGILKIQPGIESLDSEILGLMAKGCTLMQNVQTLKLAAECGMYVEWGFLYGFPGETAEQYARIAAIVPRLAHLNPPGGITPVRADRFSPYFLRPDQYGVRLEPMRAYKYIFRQPTDLISKLAYHFSMVSDQLAHADEYARPALDAIGLWHRNRLASSMYATDDGESIEVVRERAGETPRRTVLSGVEATIYRYCWKARTRGQLARMLGGTLSERALDAVIAELDASELVLRERERILSLALRQPGWRRAPLAEELRKSRGLAYVGDILPSDTDDATIVSDGRALLQTIARRP